MLICCWSAKGGSGVTVVAAGLALAASRVASTTLVDLCGDLPAALGVAEPDRVGVPAPVTPHLQLVLLDGGEPAPLGSFTRAPGDDVVVVDAGVLHGLDAPAASVVARADRSLLVMRPCFLALRRAARLGGRPHGVVLVTEPGRALGAADVSDVLGAPVLAEVPVDASISRAVDAGLLAVRCPQVLVSALERVP